MQSTYQTLFNLRAQTIAGLMGILFCVQKHILTHHMMRRPIYFSIYMREQPEHRHPAIPCFSVVHTYIYLQVPLPCNKYIDVRRRARRNAMHARRRVEVIAADDERVL